jgi:NADH-quinone oxidoreductase subunit H
MRSAAQFISYEIPGVLAVLTPVLLAGSMSLQDIVEAQRPVWFVFYPIIGQIAFVLFMIAGVAESNRTPFDLVEAESEIIAGFHTEYSGMRFALFFLAEYANVFSISAIGATLFLGGYTLFGLEQFIPGYLILIGKASALVFVFFWLRGTLPRLRYDQLMNFAWKGMLPVALLNVVLTGAGVSLFQAFIQPMLTR